MAIRIIHFNFIPLPMLLILFYKRWVFEYFGERSKRNIKALYNRDNRVSYYHNIINFY